MSLSLQALLALAPILLGGVLLIGFRVTAKSAILLSNLVLSRLFGEAFGVLVMIDVFRSSLSPGYSAHLLRGRLDLGRRLHWLALCLLPLGFLPWLL